MVFDEKEIEFARKFVAKVKFKAELDPNDPKSVRFIMEPQFPQEIGPEMADVLRSCADYFQRSIFLGEYEPREEDGPLPEFANAIDDMNYKLDYFLEEFRYEVKKAIEAEKVSISPFAREMLKYRKITNRRKSDRPKKDQN